MKKLNFSDAGFGAIEALLILVIIGLTGFVGWYVWQSRSQSNSTVNNQINQVSSKVPDSTETKQSEDTRQPDISANIITFSNKNSTVSYRSGESFTIKLDGAYWGDLTLAPTGIAVQTAKSGVNCKPEFGCDSTNYSLKTVSKGTVTVSASRNQCGEALACQNGAGEFSVTINIQ